MQYKGKERRGEVIEEEESAHNYGEALWPQIKFIACPIRTSLGILGKKWTILILRDIGFLRIDRFNRILESITGLTPRILSIRLKQLEKEGFIERIEEKRSPIAVRWRLTEKGKDTLPILMQLVAFGSKWYSDIVFEDKMPRELNEIFPQPEAKKFIRGIT
ncbi:MAG TPA: helix-turn-helix domain-containing protein [Nitrososphaeraceae archaeon]|nr:helix-turn-helix domain-containing protein [Nitrososphaeraceae archaeon]